MPKKSYTYRLSDEAAAAIKSYAESEDRPEAWVVEKAVLNYVTGGRGFSPQDGVQIMPTQFLSPPTAIGAAPKPHQGFFLSSCTPSAPPPSFHP